MNNKSFLYTMKQDANKNNIWHFRLFKTKEDLDNSKFVLYIKVYADNGRFTLQKSANLDLKIVSDSMCKILEFLRLTYNQN